MSQELKAIIQSRLHGLLGRLFLLLRLWRFFLGFLLLFERNLGFLDCGCRFIGWHWGLLGLRGLGEFRLHCHLGHVFVEELERRVLGFLRGFRRLEGLLPVVSRAGEGLGLGLVAGLEVFELLLVVVITDLRFLFRLVLWLLGFLVAGLYSRFVRDLLLVISSAVILLWIFVFSF